MQTRLTDPARYGRETTAREPTRRTHRNQLERDRRMGHRHKLYELRDLIPELQHFRPPVTEILDHARARIELLTAKCNDLVRDLGELEQMDPRNQPTAVRGRRSRSRAATSTSTAPPNVAAADPLHVFEQVMRENAQLRRDMARFERRAQMANLAEHHVATRMEHQTQVMVPPAAYQVHSDRGMLRA